MSDEIICLYHGQCTDGSAAAAIIQYKYPDAQCFPMQHGDPIPASVKNKILFIVDFSFDLETLKRLKSEAKEVYWYDHHKTALPTHQALGWGVLDLSESGASLTWKQEFPARPVPQIIRYVKDKDLWEWKLPSSREVSMALREFDEIHSPGSETWKRWIEGVDDREFSRLIELGSISLNSQRLRIVNGAKLGFEVDFHGHKTLAVNWILESSEMGEYIYKDLGYEIALIFSYTGSHWSFSLRSNKVDISQIALQYGGGGHPGASGFRRNSIDWLFQMKKG